MFDVWIIEDFDAFNEDPQYSGFVTIDGLIFEEVKKLQKILMENGKTYVVKPSE